MVVISNIKDIIKSDPKLPQEVELLFKIFGSKIRLVGGSVRDLIMKKSVNDFDFATPALPEEIITILQENNLKSVATGLKFGTITAVINGKNFEITTLRQDFDNDGRHCKAQFVDDYYLDAARRDFTINALYLDNKGQIFDYFDGVNDIKDSKLQFIGDASLRIKEDFLRILRFFRFNVEYAKDIDKIGFDACIKNRHNLSKLSRERIRNEFIKIINSTNKDNIIKVLRLMSEQKIIDVLFGLELDYKALDLLFKLEKKFNINSDTDLKLVVLFMSDKLDLAKLSQEICLTNKEKSFFQQTRQFNIDKNKIETLLAEGRQNFLLKQYLLFLVDNFQQINFVEAKKNIDFLKNFITPTFVLNGDDLLNEGFKPGKEMGIALKKAKKYWAESGFKLNKSDLIKLVKT